MQANDSILQTAITAFKSASPDVQAAIVGNLGIVAGALMTLIVTATIATRQFRHERLEKAKDRALEVKKEVLLSGVRGAQQLLSGISQFSNLRSSPEQITSDIQQGIGLMTVAGAVASLKTVEMARYLIEASGPVVMELIGRRRPLDDIQFEIDLAQQQIDRIENDNRNILGLQQQAIAAARNEEAKFYNSIFQNNHRHFSDLVAHRAHLINKLESLHVPLVRKVFEVQSKISNNLRSLIAQVRIDIGIDSDPVGYLSASHVDMAEIQKSLDNTLDQFLRDSSNSNDSQKPLDA